MLKYKIPQIVTLTPSNLLIVKGDEEFGKRKGLFQVPSFSDPLGARTQDPNIKSVVLYLLS